MNIRRQISADELENLYVENRLTIDEIAAYYDCGATTIRRRLDDLGIPTRSRGPDVDPGLTTGFQWSSELAYAVGLLATDGNLSKDGRHLTVTSADRDLLETFCDCLGLDCQVRPQAGFLKTYYRVQWSDRSFYNWLLGVGLMPAKSLKLGKLEIPDEYFIDFVRGCLDGDGNLDIYIDRHLASKKETYVYKRLFVRFASASLPFLEWLQAEIAEKLGTEGRIHSRKQRLGRSPSWELKYGKADSIQLLRSLYQSPGVPCLARKRNQAFEFLEPF